MIFLGEDMRKLLNTIYVTNEAAYLTLDGENLVCKIEGKEKLRIPFENIENVVCFSYLGCSPALMGKCVEKTIPINFISPQGKFWAKVCGETKGNVFLRVAQIEQFRENGLTLAQNTLAAKFSNTRQLIRRTLHDNAELREDAEIKKAITFHIRSKRYQNSRHAPRGRVSRNLIRLPDQLRWERHAPRGRVSRNCITVVLNWHIYVTPLAGV